jgi:endo-1,4-beta-xylanase
MTKHFTTAAITRLLFLLWVMAAVIPAYGQKGLRDALGDRFLIGAALNQWQTGVDNTTVTAIVKRHFNTAVAENCMKSGPIHPEENRYDFSAADQFVDYCERNGLVAIGHCLVWHSQAPGWLFYTADGQLVSRDELIRRIQQHIKTVVGRYKGRIHGWDVVNEAIEDDGTLRKSLFYQIIGEDFIDIAFQAAHEADPEAELYYNDYSMSLPAKRDAACRLVQRLKAKGLRIDGVGMQSHLGLDYPDLNEYERSIEAIAQSGVKVMITELDVNVLPSPQSFNGAEVSQDFEYQQRLNPYPDGLPADKAAEFQQRYLDLFAIYLRHHTQISRVNLWGISDADSWLNGWPVKGRTNYPLLFDRQYQPKPVIDKIIQLFSTAP